jgi:hypothetical protein
MPPLDTSRFSYRLTGVSGDIYGDSWNGRGIDFVTNMEPCRST